MSHLVLLSASEVIGDFKLSSVSKEDIDVAFFNNGDNVYSYNNNNNNNDDNNKFAHFSGLLVEIMRHGFNSLSTIESSSFGLFVLSFFSILTDGTVCGKLQFCTLGCSGNSNVSVVFLHDTTIGIVLILLPSPTEDIGPTRTLILCLVFADMIPHFNHVLFYFLQPLSMAILNCTFASTFEVPRFQFPVNIATRNQRKCKKKTMTVQGLRDRAGLFGHRTNWSKKVLVTLVQKVTGQEIQTGFLSQLSTLNILSTI